MIGAVFDRRDFTPYIGKHWRKIDVEKYSKTAVGGSLRATLTAYGTDQQMFEFADMLRCPVRIYDYARAECVWLGYISKVEINTTGGMMFGVDIEQMANRIRVMYSTSRERETTDWASDTDSQGEYGIKELTLSQSEMLAEQVEQLRNIELEARKYPPRMPLRWGAKRPEAICKIECYGWYQTLGWRYAPINGGLLEYVDEDPWMGREIGEDDRPIAGMSFTNTTGADFNATSIWLRCLKIGSPTDTLQIDLYTNNGSTTVPDALMSGTGDITGANLTNYYAWYEFTLDSAQTLVNGTKYWITGRRTGSISLTNYFGLDGNESAGYPYGEHKVSTPTGTWTSKPQDLNFRIAGKDETTDQLTTLVTTYGQFYEDVHIVDVTSVDSIPFRDGDSTCLYEVTEMLKVGTTNGRRLLADTTPQRVLRVYEMPTRTSDDYTIDAVGTIRDKYHNKIRKSQCPVAYWARLVGVIPSTANMSRIQSGMHMFVESAEYNVKTDTYSILESGEAGGPWDFLMMREG